MIVQGDAFAAMESVVVCPFTTNKTEAPLFRVVVAPDGVNGLSEETRIMLDKVTAIPRASLGKRIGSLSDLSMTQIGRGLVVFLGIG
ncbi:type II toxin-antitoxin system PemK/MazF family toxin [Saccharomonospora sp. NPDC046836]|uniref:type II toxin-antitoxin system PemK/MazF family toxin n=1 Tax=Saccharomonospora sp. NPDC046836 TaxID=3156921 RepID=UPI00340AD122